MSEPLLKIGDVAALLQCSHASVFRRVKDGTIPHPRKFGALSRWQRADIEAAINAASPAVEARQ